jgi:hypothetical protein
MCKRFALPVALLFTACATPGPPPVPSRTPTAAERQEAQRAIVSPYLACMKAEARKLSDGGVGGNNAVDASELKCGRLVQALRQYGAANNYEPLSWGEYVAQVERNGRAAAASAAAQPR